MVFNFRIVSDEVNNFKREIQIDSDATFADLKDAICESVGYDRNAMSSFYLCDDGWEKEKEITLEDMGSDSDNDIYIMEDSILADFIDDEGQKLMFTFDYLNDRSFFMEMRDMITGRSLQDPICTLSQGNPPAQTSDLDFDTSDILAKPSKTTVTEDPGLDIEDTFYGDDEYNPDELDAEGFDELNMDE